MADQYIIAIGFKALLTSVGGGYVLGVGPHARAPDGAREYAHIVGVFEGAVDDGAGFREEMERITEDRMEHGDAVLLSLPHRIARYLPADPEKIDAALRAALGGRSLRENPPGHIKLKTPLTLRKKLGVRLLDLSPC